MATMQKYIEKRDRHAFTLVEVVAVIIIIVVLASVILIRVGDVRTASYQAVAAQIERSFAKGVEDLAVNGKPILPAMQVATTGCALIGSSSADAAYLGLSTKTYALSTRSSPNLSNVNGALNALDTQLRSAGYGAVSGSATAAMLEKLNVSLITISDSSNNIVDAAIKFTK